MDWILILLLKYKYFVLLPLAMFQGSITSLISGFLVYRDFLNINLAFIILLLGDFIPDTIFYYIGYFGQNTKIVKRYVLENKIFFHHHKVISKLWSEHGRKTMTLGKLSYGFAIPFLVSAGMVKVPYRKFISYAMVVSTFHYGLIFLIGYLLGSSYASAKFYMNFLHYGLAIISISLLIIYFVIIRYARRKVIGLVEEEEKEIEGR